MKTQVPALQQPYVTMPAKSHVGHLMAFIAQALEDECPGKPDDFFFFLFSRREPQVSLALQCVFADSLLLPSSTPLSFFQTFVRRPG